MIRNKSNFYKLQRLGLIALICRTLFPASAGSVQAQNFNEFFEAVGTIISAPGPRPTRAPVVRPPDESIQPSSLLLSQHTFELGVGISIHFSYGSDPPHSKDWIGIFPADADPTLDLPTSFLFQCNRQTECLDSPSIEGEVRFDDTMLEETLLPSWKWPIDIGEYRAHLLRGTQAPFQWLASTESFQILERSMPRPTPAPLPNPTPRPTPMPTTPRPTPSSLAPAIRTIETDTRNLIAQDPFMGPKFVRLGFHDCTGGCDGCVDLTDPENAGLHLPMDALRPIVVRHENPDINISRADIWAIAAHVAADVAQERSHVKVDFRTEFVGRQNCEATGGQCLDRNGIPRACTETLGPFRHIPEPDTNTQELFHFFSDEFGFDMQETVALMGAHTLGALNRHHTGFDGPNGWVRENLKLDNDYYHELVGGTSRNDPLHLLIDQAPPWDRLRMNNEDVPGMPNKPAWLALPPAFDGSGVVEIIMLNVDIAIVRELDHTNMLPDGTVLCAFVAFFAARDQIPRCPHAAQSLEFAADYKFDNTLWLNDFAKVYKKMLNHGYPYDPTRLCPEGICVYEL